MTLRPEAMRRCLANLIGNAQRHARTIAVAATALDDGVEITIDDDGPGIPADKREDVFRPFVRLDPSRNSETGGIGLGLTIARDVARSHGGDLELLGRRKAACERACGCRFRGRGGLATVPSAPRRFHGKWRTAFATSAMLA